MTLPFWGFSLAVSGRTMPLASRLLLLYRLDDQPVAEGLQLHPVLPPFLRIAKLGKDSLALYRTRVPGVSEG